jgi:putative YphP/YqiW family bacilliredoxin
VFAGQDREVTDTARAYFTSYPPSSPPIALLRDGQLVYMMERWQMEGRPAPEIAADLVSAFAEHCSSAAR